MEINESFLKKAVINLKNQEKELIGERNIINEQIAEVRGAWKWVEQMLKLLKKPPA